MDSTKVDIVLGSARAGRPCHDVDLVNDSLFTHNTSPGGAALLLPGPRGPGVRRRKTPFCPHRYFDIAPPGLDCDAMNLDGQTDKPNRFEFENLPPLPLPTLHSLPWN